MLSKFYFQNPYVYIVCKYLNVFLCNVDFQLPICTYTYKVYNRRSSIIQSEKEKMLHVLLLLIVRGLAKEIYVDSGAFSDSSCGNRSSPCPTLEAALNNTALDSVTVQVLSSTLTLNHQVVLENSTAFSLRGSEDGGTLITCSSSPGIQPGLVFVGLDNVVLLGVNFTGCGIVRDYPKLNISYMAAIHLYWCKDVTISNLKSTANRGAGLAIIDPQGGTVSISHSQFSKNRVPVELQSKYSGGAGVYVRESNETGGDPVQLQLFHCVFEHNQATFPFIFTFLNVLNRPRTGSGRGGGVDIQLRQAIWNSINISSCSFHNNTAYLGGGLAIQINENSHHNRVLVKNCTFEENGCVEGNRAGSGGGAHFGFGYTEQPLESVNNSFSIEHSRFRVNCADLGGGMTFFTPRSNERESALSNEFLLDCCEWTGNVAHIGAAVDISPHSESRTREGFLPIVVFKECKFFRNHNIFHHSYLHHTFGSGVVFSSLVDVDFVKTVHFQYNNGSALVIVNAIANFTESDGEFVGNTGVQGGAISLTGISSLVVGPGKTYNFTENHATDRGGAIYNYLIDNHDFTVSETCFLYHSGNNLPLSKWNVSFYFINNTAGAYGHSIFSSSTISCVESDAAEDDTIRNAKIFFKWPGVFHYDERTENQIATEGSSFTANESLPFHVIPGKVHNLGIVTTDENGQEIETIFRASMINTSDSAVGVDDAFSCVSGNTIKMRGETGSSGVLVLETISSRKDSLAINVTLLPCPPGFVLTGDECTCNVETYSAVVGCDSRNFQASIKVGYWAGYIDNVFATGICPLSFCSYNGNNYEREVPLPKNSSPSHLDEYICGPTRTGILCGSCKPGYSVFYHSPGYSCHRSRYCDWGWLFYILSELVPVTVIFVAILALNISFTSGKMNGFILFSQLLDSVIINGSGVVQYPALLSKLSWGYQLIYGVFTMEFFSIEPLSFCLWEGATVLDILAFRYITIIYAFLLVLMTLIFIKYCGHLFARKRLRITAIKASVIHGLSAFIILCYAQATKVSIYILIYGIVRGKYGKKRDLYVFFNGDTGLYSMEHLPYALPALLCLMTISATPPVLLLLYPSANKLLEFCKVSDRRVVVKVSRMIPISKIKPFLDSFQGCFKDNLRFFAGIYFVYRWIGLMMFALVPTITGFYISLGIIYILVLMLHALFQPYTNRVYNIVDGCLFANLALIYSIAAYNYLFSQGLIETFSTQTTYITTMTSIQLILIYLPIVGMAVYLGFLLYKFIPKNKKPATPSESITLSRRKTVTSTDINDLLCGPEEFPPRMLEANYGQYEDTPVSSHNNNQFVETYL